MHCDSGKWNKLSFFSLFLRALSWFVVAVVAVSGNNAYAVKSYWIVVNKIWLVIADGQAAFQVWSYKECKYISLKKTISIKISQIKIHYQQLNLVVIFVSWTGYINCATKFVTSRSKRRRIYKLVPRFWTFSQGNVALWRPNYRNESTKLILSVIGWYIQ